MKQTIPRIVRIGDIDVEIKEHREYPPDNYQVPSRIWFVAPSGLETSTYGEMLDKLGARPKPVLPEDEYRASSAADAAPSVRRRTEAHDKPALFKGAYPWTNDTRPNEELSEDEIDMQLIWYAEQIRERNPDLYEAALDSVKRQEYLDRLERLKQLDREAEEEQMAADLAPRCQFIKSDGDHCGAPAVKKQKLCHFHHSTTRDRKKKPKKLDLPVLEDDLAIQMAVTNVCRGLADESIEPKRAATLLYGLQVAAVVRRKAMKSSSRSDA